MPSIVAALASSAELAPMPDPGLPSIQFTTVKKLLRKSTMFLEIFSTSQVYYTHLLSNPLYIILTILDVSPQDFSDIEKERSLRRRKFRYRRYQAGFKTLIVTIPTRVHERLHLELYAKVYSKIMTMGLADGWAAMGGTTLRAQGQHPGVDVGEGDSTGGPCQRSGLLDWPTLVIEAGHSQSLAEFRNDMR